MKLYLLSRRLLVSGEGWLFIGQAWDCVGYQIETDRSSERMCPLEPYRLLEEVMLVDTSV